MLNSTYWDDTDEVAAFEELVGSHGGMGGTQSYPFLLHPAELELPDEEIVGPEAVHRHLRRWLVALGHGGVPNRGGSGMSLIGSHRRAPVGRGCRTGRAGARARTPCAIRSRRVGCRVAAGHASEAW